MTQRAVKPPPRQGWWLATRGQHPRPELVGAFAPLVMLLPGTAVAAVAPQYAQFIWALAFGALLAHRLVRDESGKAG